MVWAVVVLTAMAYAGIAGLPPVGLYTVPLPVIGTAVVGTARRELAYKLWRIC